MADSSTYRKIERIVKGFANHRRIQILDLLKQSPELSVDDIADRLNIGYENASDHIRKLAIAGLVMKRYEGTTVRHKLTERGETILVFCKKLK
ncbi:MAG: winged helix-turn-helix domain-containing protein [Candidatus Paceibacterota bacterium]